jgi:hypothetical protein
MRQMYPMISPAYFCLNLNFEIANNCENIGLGKTTLLLSASFRRFFISINRKNSGKQEREIIRSRQILIKLMPILSAPAVTTNVNI